MFSFKLEIWHVHQVQWCNVTIFRSPVVNFVYYLVWVFLSFCPQIQSQWMLVVNLLLVRRHYIFLLEPLFLSYLSMRHKSLQLLHFNWEFLKTSHVYLLRYEDLHILKSVWSDHFWRIHCHLSKSLNTLHLPQNFACLNIYIMNITIDVRESRMGNHWAHKTETKTKINTQHNTEN